MSKEQTWPSKEVQEELKSLMERASKGLQIRDFVRGDFPTPKEFERLYLQEPKPIVVGVGGPSPQKITHNGDIYIRRDVVEHIIRGSLGPKEVLTKIRSL